MAQGDQVKNGKAFEYALAIVYADKLREMGVNVSLIENSAYKVAQGYFTEFPEGEQMRYQEAALQTIDTMVRLEPGLIAQRKANDKLLVCLNEDDEGISGDVRDVVFSRTSPKWEIGFSAKNNNDAVKHSRLSSVLDFGDSWVNVPCSQPILYAFFAVLPISYNPF